MLRPTAERFGRSFVELVRRGVALNCLERQPRLPFYRSCCHEFTTCLMALMPASNRAPPCAQRAHGERLSDGCVGPTARVVPLVISLRARRESCRRAARLHQPRHAPRGPSRPSAASTHSPGSDARAPRSRCRWLPVARRGPGIFGARFALSLDAPVAGFAGLSFQVIRRNPRAYALYKESVHAFAPPATDKEKTRKHRGRVRRTGQAPRSSYDPLQRIDKRTLCVGFEHWSASSRQSASGGMCLHMTSRYCWLRSFVWRQRSSCSRQRDPDSSELLTVDPRYEWGHAQNRQVWSPSRSFPGERNRHGSTLRSKPCELSLWCPCWPYRWRMPS